MNKASAMPRPKPHGRRRYAPLILAIGLAALVWMVIALGGAVLTFWLG